MKENQNQSRPTASSSAPAAPANSSAPAAQVTTPVVPAIKSPVVAAPPEALAKAQQIVAEANELLQNGVAEAVKALGHSLRVMIANQFPETDGGRRIAEVAFENAKNVPAGKATRVNLADAITGLTTAVNHIANHSLKFPGDLDVLRTGLNKLTNVAEQYDALIVPVVVPATFQPAPLPAH